MDKPKRRRTPEKRVAPCWRGVGDSSPYVAGLPPEVPRFRSVSDLFTEMACCTRCDLARARTQVVVGVGPKRADVMLIGEAPGAQEDQEGKPFVGSAGRYLDRLLGHAGLDRGAVFITNIAACRPPQNRAPKISEIRAHAPWIEEQLRLVRPRLIVTLGRSALIYFLPKEKITQIHGKVRAVEHPLGQVWLLPTFHPAAAFRNEDIKPLIEQDFAAIAPALRKLG